MEVSAPALQTMITALTGFIHDHKQFVCKADNARTRNSQIDRLVLILRHSLEDSLRVCNII